MESVLDGPEESKSSVIPLFHFEALTSTGSYFNLTNAVSCLINRHLISPPPQITWGSFFRPPSPKLMLEFTLSPMLLFGTDLSLNWCFRVLTFQEG